MQQHPAHVTAQRSSAPSGAAATVADSWCRRGSPPPARWPPRMTSHGCEAGSSATVGGTAAPSASSRPSSPPSCPPPAIALGVVIVNAVVSHQAKIR